MEYDKLIEDMREIAGKNSVSLYKRGRCADAATAIETLRADLARVTAERDAAIRDLERICRDDIGPCEMSICELCAYNNGDKCSSPDGKLCDCTVFNWKWRGIKED